MFRFVSYAHVLTDPNITFSARANLVVVLLIVITLCMWVKRISWLIRSVESKTCLGEYDVEVLGDGCTAVIVQSYIRRLNTLRQWCHYKDQMADNQIYLTNCTKTLSVHILSPDTYDKVSIRV